MTGHLFGRTGCGSQLARSAAGALALLLALAAPASAHHGKDFLITATDDMPLPGHLYLVASADDTFDTDAQARDVELTPGVLFALNENTSLEPHFHFGQIENGGYAYSATAVELRHRFGFVGQSEWRWAGSVEFERPKADASNVAARLILARNFAQELVAVNLIAGRALQGDPGQSWGIITSALRPVDDSNNAGLEILTNLPVNKGVEILPGIYHMFGGAAGATSLRLGVGYFFSDTTRGGTLHASLIHRF